MLLTQGWVEINALEQEGDICDPNQVYGDIDYAT
jgi:hypothetical protein